jgi:hypothetical protein
MAQRTLSITPPVTWEKFGGETESIFAKINDNFTELYLSIGGSGVDLTSLGSSLIPNFDEDHDLGSSSKKWDNIYVSSTGLHIGTAVITSTGSIVDLPLGSTIGGVPPDVPDDLSVTSIELDSGVSVNNISSDTTFGVDVDNSTLSTKLAIKTYVDNEIPTDINQLSDVDSLLGAALESRTTAVGTTSGLANNASENLTVVGFKSYALLKISTNRASWIRVYTSQAARTADTSRLITDDPLPGSGVIAEAITDGFTPVLISPSIIGFNDETIPTSDIYIRVTNTSGTTGSVTVTLFLIKLEA